MRERQGEHMKKETSNIIVFPKNLFPLNVISKYDFGVVLSDPPWMNMGGEKHYPTMSLDAIKSMPIKALTKENAACFLWITKATPHNSQSKNQTLCIVSKCR